ncbi:hypothetical protein BC939DRAFT_166056 [Gamsiella multidivaricata]|uniref:uncharacterized protein n=1 Tax=Gamsiella multidivaricata TaxID=101098 RepID=UPI00221E40D2|nr:uncharacterized protein BC939DRAFT_166056 [Gamsiella multidivaricata]KAI7823183.1 hypothetical protein BC939DRAFT_166056 [Gamsiella multidivaricata]
MAGRLKFFWFLERERGRLFLSSAVPFFYLSLTQSPPSPSLKSSCLLPLTIRFPSILSQGSLLLHHTFPPSPLVVFFRPSYSSFLFPLCFCFFATIYRRSYDTNIIPFLSLLEFCWTHPRDALVRTSQIDCRSDQPRDNKARTHSEKGGAFVSEGRDHWNNNHSFSSRHVLGGHRVTRPRRQPAGGNCHHTSSKTIG